MQQIQRRIIYSILILAGLIWINFSTDHNSESTNGQIPAPRQNFLAPDFSLQTIEGETIQLSGLRGNVVLVNLWATWCPPCRAEMPAIQKMYEEYKDDGFMVIAVNMTNQDEINSIQPFLQEYELTFPVPLDTSGEVAKYYNLRSLPSSYFIDRQGIIREVVIGGPMAEALLRTRIESLLK